MANKKAVKELAAKLARLLTEAESMRTLIGRRVVGVGFMGEAEGTYTLTFDDGSQASFSSSGDDVTWTSFTKFQQNLIGGKR